MVEDSSPYILELRGIRKSFGPNPVLSGVDLGVRRGEIVGLIGPSGGGKSTILKSVIGLARPDEGEVIVSGVTISGLEERELTHWRQRIAYVFQNGALFDAMTVEENLSYPLQRHTDYTDGRIRMLVNERLRTLELTGTNDRYPNELSGGMQKRVGLARATMLDPEIALLDEPTAGLDPPAIRHFIRNLRLIRSRRQVSGIYVTHDIPSLFAVSDRIAVLRDGRIAALDSVEAIRGARDPAIRDLVDTDYEGCRP